MRLKLATGAAALLLLSACDNIFAPPVPAEGAAVTTETPAVAEVQPLAGLFKDAAATATADETLNLSRAAALAPAANFTSVVASGDVVVATGFDGTATTVHTYRFAADGAVADQWTVSEVQAASAAPAMTMVADDAAEAVNRDVVIGFIGKTFNERKLAEAAAAAVDPAIKYHGATAVSGVEAYTALLAAAEPKNAAYDIKTIAAQNDLVTLTSLMIGGADPAVQQRAMVVDTFRLAGGKIVEHWRIVQPEV